ncbi:hypothetical protein GGR53DRAFT_46565 [Hypoxylon sp. FL1150]|nr:hypothetical protein GGR53DRAFT_46565 [Hypoxylon sp. FL1150]
MKQNRRLLAPVELIVAPMDLNCRTSASKCRMYGWKSSATLGMRVSDVMGRDYLHFFMIGNCFLYGGPVTLPIARGIAHVFQVMARQNVPWDPKATQSFCLLASSDRIVTVINKWRWPTRPSNADADRHADRHTPDKVTALRPPTPSRKENPPKPCCGSLQSPLMF